MNETRDEIRRTITVPEQRELTADDYVILLYASVSDLDTGYPRLNSERFERLKTLGFVRKAATLERPLGDFVPICATTEGRVAALVYLQQMLVVIDQNEGKV